MKKLSLICVALLLAACSSSDGDGNTGTPTPPTTPTPTPPTLDAFYSTVATFAASPSETGEPQDVSGFTPTTPENTEPAEV